MEWLFELYVNVTTQEAVKSRVENGDRLFLVAIRDDRIWHVDVCDMGCQIVFTEAHPDWEKYWDDVGRMEYIELGCGVFAVRRGVALSLVEWHLWRELGRADPNW